MSDDAPQGGAAAEVAGAADGGRRVRRRVVTVPHSTADMGVMGAFQNLKGEAAALQRLGAQACIERPELMQPHLARYLNGHASLTYVDEEQRRLCSSL